MIREFKFRAWNKERKKMYQVQKMLLGAAGEGIFQVTGISFKDFEISTMNICDEECQEKTPHCELMQYTGLKDKQGKEIYISDILRWGKDIIEIKDDYIELATLSKGSVVNLEIIGNIYEDSNLLDNK